MTTDPPISTFKAQLNAAGPACQLVLAGSAEASDVEALERALAEFHAVAQEHGARDVEIDFRALEFITSACLKPLVAWLSRARDLPAGKEYRIHFLSNFKHLWQKRSLQALSCFASDLVVID